MEAGVTIEVVSSGRRFGGLVSVGLIRLDTTLSDLIYLRRIDRWKDRRTEQQRKQAMYFNDDLDQAKVKGRRDRQLNE